MQVLLCLASLLLFVKLLTGQAHAPAEEKGGWNAQILHLASNQNIIFVFLSTGRIKKWIKTFYSAEEIYIFSGP